MSMAFAPKKSHFETASKEPAEPNKGYEEHESGDNTDGSEHDISHLGVHEAVAQHGPAHTLDIHHSEGNHHVHAIHGEGMHHHSDHGSAEAAHEHAKVAAGVGGEEDQERSAVGDADADDEEAMIPGTGSHRAPMPGHSQFRRQ